MTPRTSLALACLLTLCSGCDPKPTAPQPKPEIGERVFEARGAVRNIAPDRRTAVIRHEEIPGYMPRMVMELHVRNTNDLAGVHVGDDILFRLHATADTHWIDSIRRLGASTAPASPAVSPDTARASRELKPGDELPDHELLSETGARLRFSDFRGQALALTFFFTRCPLPDYCPRMNRNFSEARDLLNRRADGPTNWHFLCISFDPDFDKPAVLARYASLYRNTNTHGWTFASASSATLATLGPPLDLMVSKEPGTFSHNLRTVVLDREGRIRRQFDGNGWTPAELADAVQEAAR